jgi:hypothetical protein
MMRALRDVDLHRPVTRRRRHVEFPKASVYIPSVTHQCRAPTTHRTSTCMQSHQRNHHYRDCLYNIRHNTEHKYINLGRLRGYHLPKKRTNVPSQNPTLQTPSFPKAPRNRLGRRPPSSEVAQMYKTLFPPCDEVEHDSPIAHRLIGSYHYDTFIHLCPYAPSRRTVGWSEVNRSLTPVRTP